MRGRRGARHRDGGWSQPSAALGAGGLERFEHALRSEQHAPDARAGRVVDAFATAAMSGLQAASPAP